MPKLFTIPLSLIYGLVVALRNALFDHNVIKSSEYDIPIVCIGNLSAGGTGKTPHTEMVVRLLSKEYNVAVLSRGYRRKSKGYRIVNTSSKCSDVGDEPKQIKLKYPSLPVVVCEDRCFGIDQLRKDFPKVNLVILDDGFQHRKVETWLSILLTEHSKPFYEDRLLPWGRLRESAGGMSRAQVVVITKTDPDIKPIDMRLISKYLNMYPYQTLFFTYMVQKEAVAVFNKNVKMSPEEGCDVIVMSAIANNNSFSEQVALKYNVVDTLSFPDHYNYKKRDLDVIISLLEKYPSALLMVTEKDAVKFMSSTKIPTTIKERMYMIPIEVEFVKADKSRNNTEEDFLNAILPYVRQNHKHSSLGY